MSLVLNYIIGNTIIVFKKATKQMAHTIQERIAGK